MARVVHGSGARVTFTLLKAVSYVTSYIHTIALLNLAEQSMCHHNLGLNILPSNSSSVKTLQDFEFVVAGSSGSRGDILWAYEPKTFLNLVHLA